MTVSMVDYHWNGSNYVNSGTFTFDPEPSSINKTAKVQWTVRHSGINELKKCRWRYRRTEQIVLEGILTSESNRLTLEAYATRNSKYKLNLDSRFESPTSEGISYGSTIPATAVTSYFTVTDFTCSQVPGKLHYTYKITFERVEPVA